MATRFVSKREVAASDAPKAILLTSAGSVIERHERYLPRTSGCRKRGFR